MDLGDLKRRIVDAHAKRPALARRVAIAEWRLWFARLRRWLLQWPLLRDLFDATSAVRAVGDAELAAAAARADLDRGGVVTVDFPLSEEAIAARDALLRTFELLRASAMIWSVEAATEVDRARHRSSAIAALVRHAVTFDRSGSAVIGSQTAPLHLPGAHGELRFYPGFLMVGDVPSVHLVDLDDCRFEYAHSDFIEQHAVPSDAEHIGSHWLKANKDGSPDRRFRDNRELPLIRYGHLEITANGMVLAVYQVSDWKAARAFAKAITDYQWAVAGNARGQAT